eukprot:1953226-Rhodomonas_salina.2
MIESTPNDLRNSAFQVLGTAHWHINPDEPLALDYNTEYKTSRHVDLLYDSSPYRSSDHDPVIIAMNWQTTFQLDVLHTNDQHAR